MDKIKILFTAIIILLFANIQAQTVDISTLKEKNNLMYLNDVLYTGSCYGKHENGQIGLKGKIENGMKQGSWTWWYSSGQKKRETIFKDNKKEGLTIFWFENGQKSKEIMYRDDKNIDQKLWNEDGSRRPNPSFNQSN